MSLIEISEKLNNLIIRLSVLDSLFDLHDFLERVNSLIFLTDSLKEKNDYELKLLEIEKGITNLENEMKIFSDERSKSKISNSCKTLTFGNFKPPKMKEIKRKKKDISELETVEEVEKEEDKVLVQQNLPTQVNIPFGAFDLSVFDLSDKADLSASDKDEMTVKKDIEISKKNSVKCANKIEESIDKPKETKVKEFKNKKNSENKEGLAKNKEKTSVSKTVKKKADFKISEVVLPESLIDLEIPYIKENIELLLKDRTTGKRIFWATDSYAEQYGKRYEATDAITEKCLYDLDKSVLQPRVLKSIAAQKNRTKSKAEVFTPSWICNKMNNLLDEEWFGYKEIFNVENESDNTWKTNTEKVRFVEGKTFEEYINSTRLEITCGEAPFLVSRYDAATGKEIDIRDRVGLLDRKLRVINENIEDKSEWFEWVKKAYKSIYGYEYQGDNLLIARINLLITFVDYYKFKFGVEPSLDDVKDIAEIISWNVWQMDGLSYKLPMSDKDSDVYCKIMDWDTNKKIEFRNIGKEG